MIEWILNEGMGGVYMPLVKDFFIALSNNQFLNKTAKKFGPMLGANKVVAGNSIDSVIKTIKRLNKKGITVTVDNLGEFVNTREESIEAKDNILEMMQAIHDHDVQAHVSIKLSQLGAEFDLELAYDNLCALLEKAKALNNMHINIDTEKYDSLFYIIQTLDRVKPHYSNVGTVIQAYLYKAEALIDKFPELRLRLVKGAYKEDPAIAYQTKEDIDQNYIDIIEKRLLHSQNITSIATHDHNIINHVKAFAKEHDIPKDQFEFQMLYGFRTDLAESIAEEGYPFCIYVPYGDDWFGYFMRRLAERPQNLMLAFKEFFKPAFLKKAALVAAATFSVFCIFKKLRKK